MPEYVVLRESTPPAVDGRTLTARIATYGRIYTPTPMLRERVTRGAFKAPKRAGQGKYYATVDASPVAGVATCTAARSPSVRI